MANGGTQMVETFHSAGLGLAGVIHGALQDSALRRAEAVYQDRDVRSARALGALLRAERVRSAKLADALQRAEARAARAEQALVMLTGV